MVKVVGWGDSVIGNDGAKYSRYADRHKGKKGGVEFVDKHPDTNGRRKVYRKVGKKLVPVGYEFVFKNYHGRDSTQEKYFNQTFKKKKRRK